MHLQPHLLIRPFLNLQLLFKFLFLDLFVLLHLFGVVVDKVAHPLNLVFSVLDEEIVFLFESFALQEDFPVLLILLEVLIAKLFKLLVDLLSHTAHRLMILIRPEWGVGVISSAVLLDI